MAPLALDDVVDGRGGHSVWALYLQVLRELAQHAGHADILREQLLADPSPKAAGVSASRGPGRRRAAPSR